jgi:hypothetical protein
MIFNKRPSLFYQSTQYNKEKFHESYHAGKNRNLTKVIQVLYYLFIYLSYFKFFKATNFGATTINIMTLRITSLGITIEKKTLSITTPSITTLNAE